VLDLLHKRCTYMHERIILLFPLSFPLCVVTVYAILQLSELKEKSWETHFLPRSLDIFLHLLPELPERKFLVGRRLSAASYHRVIRWAEEICHRISLHLRVCHHLVLHTLVHIIAPCLSQKNILLAHTKNKLAKQLFVFACMF